MEHMESGLDLIVSEGWWLTVHRLSTPNERVNWLFESPGCSGQCWVKMETLPAFDLEWDNSVAYEEDAWIIRLVRMLPAEQTDILDKLPVAYRRFICLFSSRLAKHFPPH